MVIGAGRSLDSTSGRPHPVVLAVMALLVLGVAVHAASTLPGVRGDTGFHVYLDGWLQGSIYVLAAVLAALRALLVPAGRAVWGWVAGALGLRAFGFVYSLGYLRNLADPPYPSWADAAWLAMPVVLGVGLVNLVARRTAGLTLTLVLDGVVGALATVGLGVALLWSTLETLTPAGIPTRVLLTNIAYPALDLGLVVVVLGVLVAYAWRPPRELWWLAAGVVGFAVVDGVFLYVSARGTFHPGLPIAGLSAVATTVMAWSGWVRSPPVGDGPARRVPGLVLPTLFAVVGIGLLGWASTHDVPGAAVWLAMAALLVAVLRTALTFRDVAALAEARRAAAASGRLAAVVHASQEAICTVDATGTVTSWNPAAERLYGVPASAAVGRPVRELTGGTDQRWYDAVVRGALDGRRSHEVEVLREQPDGGVAAHLWNADPVRDEDGRVVGAAFTVRDVTAERSAEAAAAELRDRVQHARRLESLGHLAGGVAHDFNNLLGALTLTAEAQQRHLGPDHPARQDADQVLRIAQRAGQLVRQLLVFSRKESARQETVDLRTVVRQVDELLERTLGEHIDRQLDVDEAGCHVVGDAAQLEQVVLNLAINARDAMPRGGTLVIRARLVGPGSAADVPGRPAPDVPQVLLSVEDSGQGMDRDTLEHAFEPFFTTKPRGSGTGLGLAVVFGVAHAAGGEAWIESEPGRGTAVHVLLPAVLDAEQRADEAPGDPPARPRAGSLVLVEDEADLRDAVRHALREAGYGVRTYATPAAALRAASSWSPPPDLLLTDVLLPGLPGPELATRLREAHPGLRVVLMSGYVDAQALDLPDGSVVELLEKPFATAELLAVLDRHLAG